MSTPTLLTVAHIVMALMMPILLVGVINRTKSWWAARKGPNLVQTFHSHSTVSSERIRGAGVRAAGAEFCTDSGAIFTAVF